MKSEPMQRSHFLVLMFVGLGTVALVALAFGGLFGQFVFGWFRFPAAVLPQVTVDSPSLIAGIIAFAMFAFGVHHTGCWCASWLPDNLIASRTWRLRQTGFVVMAVSLLFSLGVALVGAVHQVIWLSTNRSAPSLDVSIDSPPHGLIEGARQSARQSELRNDLKQFGLGMQNFHDTLNHLPPGGTMNSDGELLHGWMMLLGPFIGFSSEEIDFGLPWNKPPNDRLYRCQFEIFLNPLQAGPVFDRDGFGLTHFAANVHVFPIRPIDPEVKEHWRQTRGLSLSDMTDGAANTLLIGTVGQNHKAWGYPANVRDPGEGLNRTTTGFGGPPGRRSAHFVMADGSVREMSDKTDPRILKALATPNGGESLDHEKGLGIGTAP